MDGCDLCWIGKPGIKQDISAFSPALRAVFSKVIIASGAFVWASARLFPARVLLSKSFTGPMIFVFFADANRQLFTGISVFPSLQLKSKHPEALFEMHIRVVKNF